jgi:hypothetical protein
VWGAETFAPRRVEELIYRLEATLDRDHMRGAIHFLAQVSHGGRRWHQGHAVSPHYYASARGLAIQDPDRIATDLAKSMVRHFQQVYVLCPKTGRWLEKETKT